LRLIVVAVAVFVLNGFCSGNLYAQSQPAPLTNTIVDGEAEAGGQTYAYTFSAGPGDVTVSAQGHTEFLSSTYQVVLTDDRGRELANIAVSASSSEAKKGTTIHLSQKQRLKLSLKFGVDVGVNVKYRVALGGAVSLQGTSTAPSDEIASLPKSVGSNERSVNANPDEVEPPDLNTPIADKWAVIVGISKFQKPELNLSYPAKDARDLRDYLVSEAHFAPDHVKLITDEQATKERVMAEIGDKWLPRLAHPNDLVLIFLSSHGSPSQMDLEGLNYLVMHNTDPKSLYATGLPLQDLANAIRQRVHANRVVIIIDACHSGAANTSKGITRTGNFDSNALAQGSGQLVICSSAPNQLSWESKRYQNGVFTRQLIQTLHSSGAKFGLRRIFEDTKEAVLNEVLLDRQEKQTPVLKSKWQGDDLMLTAPPAKPRSIPPDFNED
jgi:hypothetical protein